VRGRHSWDGTLGGENYAIALQGFASSKDRMLQYSGPYWGAAVFGQMDLALAFGACNVICYAGQPEDIASACSRYDISILGIVPSQLRGAFPAPKGKPKALRMLVTWAERTPPKLAKEWRQELPVVELLIASEYWLSFHSDCSSWMEDGTERHVLRPLPSLDFKVLKEDGLEAEPGECGELYLSGSTVFAGYVDNTGSISKSFFRELNGKSYFQTRDRLKRTPATYGGYVYMGRSDSLVKVGGAWRDLDAFEAMVTEIPGVAQCAILADGNELVAYLELEKLRQEDGTPKHGPPLKRIQDLALQRLAALGVSQLRLWSSLPLNPATAKVNRQGLVADIAARKRREATWNAQLHMVQRKMLKGYGAWHMFVVVLALAAGRFHGDWKMIFLSVLKLPFLWSAFLYVWHRLRKDRHRWVVYNSPLGPPDLFLLMALLCPNAVLRPLLLLSFATISYLRDRDVISASGFMSLCLAGLRPQLRTSQLAIVLGILSRYVLFLPSRLHFLLGLPLAYVFSFPKWYRDEFISRSTWQNSYFRRWILRAVPILQKPEFDASLCFKKNEVAYDWGSEARWVNVCMNTRENGNLSFLSFWESVRPAIIPGGPDPSDLAPATSAASEDGLTQAVTLLVARVGGEPPLLSLDSLQAIRLAELLRHELGLVISPREILGSPDVAALVQGLQAQGQQEQDEIELPDEEGAYRLYLMEWGKSPVDWYVRYGGPEHLNLEALQRACDRLVRRHSALRTTCSPDAAMREAMDRAAAMWQLICSAFGSSCPGLMDVAGKVAQRALLAAWPRTLLNEEAQVQILLPPGDVVKDPAEKFSDDDYMFRHAAELRNNSRCPFHIFVFPLVRSGIVLRSGQPLAEAVRQLAPSDVIWYIYTGITHAYSDGASGNALLQDLLRLYAEETGQNVGPVGHAPPEPMELLQRRLKASLRGRRPGQPPRVNDDVYHEILCEDWGKRPGFEKKVRLDESVFAAFHMAAKDVFGCSSDVAWLTAVVGALLRLFPNEHRVALILKCACRDGLEQHNMVGFLSEQRVLIVDVGDASRATLLDVACQIEHARKHRTWRVPQPYEASICVYINIVGSMGDGLPLGCAQVCRQTSGSSGSTDAWAHLNLRIDQLTPQTWDFRILHWDKVWGWHWGGYFISVLGAVIADMAECPLDPLVPAPSPSWRILRMQPINSVKRKDPPAGEAMHVDNGGTGPKAMRIEECS